MLHYAGIGSRKTPTHILDYMEKIAIRHREAGYVLRSGAALGADSAFERGAGSLKEIFTGNSHIPQAAMDTVDRYHPAPHRLSPYVRKLMARNALQIFGQDMQTPVDHVICWTPDGADGKKIPTTFTTGGTGQAIRIAAAHDIMVINLGNEETFSAFLKHVTLP